MLKVRYAMLALLLLLVAAPGTRAQEQQRPRRPAAAERAGGGLIGKGLEQALNLTAEQKEKLAKLDKEFAAKSQDEGKLREAMQKARQDMDRAAYQKAQEQLNEAQKVRANYVSQVQELLTADQKKTFDRIIAATPRVGAPAAGIAPLLAPGVQERLNLSAEQKDKLLQLQKDFETKALQVLTEEQRQQYERLKSTRPRRPQQDESSQAPAGVSRSRRAAR